MSTEEGLDVSKFSNEMNPNIDKKSSNLSHALSIARNALDNSHIPFMLIGGLALNRYVDPRATRDIDFAVLTHDFEKVKSVLKNAGFNPVKKSGRLWSLDGARTLKFYGPFPGMVPLDVIISTKNFFQQMIKNSELDDYTQTFIPTKEALYILKLVAYDDKKVSKKIDDSIKADTYLTDMKKLYRAKLDWKKCVMYAKLLRVTLRKPSWWVT